MAQFKNARYVTEDRQNIDIDFLHKHLGWIPMTINPREHAELWAAAEAANPPLRPVVVSDPLTGIIT